MAPLPTKQVAQIIAAAALIFLVQCGVNLPPRSTRVQQGPHAHYTAGTSVPEKTPVEDEDDPEKKREP